ncbi:pyridoxal-phosphate-dependent aminotransferase family protein [Caldicellulosiruptor acetigenus]|uniref:pyridoxal-phosphate-dependent aminotransferase family protein n=1 Tax=Caldicellulosiruptor acetigenus TaxID=301953 RepID=UPI0004049215|nr:alanine--glyoxylate aminotransferase family protein [Caldicellulosiruptor acetigenus]WAM36818.1 alanine--glyoxylate aminotransferase family protein [Caldicellulosiruptor acetigenus]
MRKPKLLMTPGPTPLPPEVIAAMSQQIIHHRTKEFGEIFSRVNENLKKVFQTKNNVLTFAASGTGAMEASAVNFFSEGDTVLVVSVGVFGDRFINICKTFGLNVIEKKYPYGDVANIDEVIEIIESNKDIKGVFITHNETSTGVTNPIEKLARYLKNTDKILIVDAVSSLGAIDLKTDEWGVDVVVTGSQKALMSPPGLAFVSVSEKAWEFYKKSQLRKFYWDFKKYQDNLLKESQDTPFTPAVTLIRAVDVGLKLILDYGLENNFKRHTRLAHLTQLAAEKLNLELLPKKEYSSAVITAIKSPEGVDIEKVRKIMNQKYDIMVTGGQATLKGKIIRIGHMGYVDEFDLLKTIECFELALLECGYKNFEVGEATKAVLQEIAKGVNS